LDDEAANFDDWFARAISRSMAQTEAYYVAIGSGTNQHEGIFTGGDTDALTFTTDYGLDSDTSKIGPKSPSHLLYTLGQGYHQDACWLMDNQTWVAIINLRDTDNWAYMTADMATLSTAGGPQAGSLLGKAVYLQDDIPVEAASTCFIMVGDPYYYTLVERKGLTIARNPYLYQANGQIGFFSSFRQSGKVTVEAAWCGGALA